MYGMGCAAEDRGTQPVCVVRGCSWLWRHVARSDAVPYIIHPSMPVHRYSQTSTGQTPQTCWVSVAENVTGLTGIEYTRPARATGE